MYKKNNNSSSGPLPEAWELQGPVQHPTGAARYIWPFSALCQSLFRNGVSGRVPVILWVTFNNLLYPCPHFIVKYREMIGGSRLAQ